MDMPTTLSMLWKCYAQYKLAYTLFLLVSFMKEQEQLQQIPKNAMEGLEEPDYKGSGWESGAHYSIASQIVI